MYYPKILAIAAMMLGTAGTASATSAYYVGNAAAAGAVVNYRGTSFNSGVNAFTDLKSLMAARPEAGSTVYVDAGTYADAVTIDIPGLTFLGANAYGDARSSNRQSAESVVSAALNVTADNVTINGFRFTEAGCVTNTTATNTAPMSGLSFVYNIADGSSLPRNTSQSILHLGAYFTGSTAGEAAAIGRYRDITVAHNDFNGRRSTANQPYVVWIAGSAGTTVVEDNRFDGGGTSVSLINTTGSARVDNNIFTNVGDTLAAAGSAKGEFCIRLFYVGVDADATDVSVCRNSFDNCHGQSSVYPLIRLFNGDKADTSVKPVNTTIRLNYNSFKRKPKHSSQTYNYVFYANKDYTSGATVDARFNQFDNSEYAMGMIQQPWESTQTRYFGGLTTMFHFPSSYGTTIDYYKDPLGDDVKALQLKSDRVAQSFDVDDTTGDIYFVQICPSDQASGRDLKGDEPLCVTRYYKNTDGKMRQQYMYMQYAGHGSNMAVCRMKDGKLYIFTGGNSLDTSTTPAAAKVKSRACCIFPFVAGATADLTKTSFTYNDKTYKIRQFRNHFDRDWQYPTVDRDNRLYAERQTYNKVVYFAIYDLDDVFDNVNNARPIKVIPFPYDCHPATTGALAGYDEGFQTWPSQGFTVYGDYIYHFEGVGVDNSQAITYNGKKIPTVIVHAHNWRMDRFVYRRPVLRNLIINLSSGEPEGVKLHRDKYGRPHMLMGIVSGAAGARKANIFDFTPNTTDGFSFTIDAASTTSATSSMSFVCNNILETDSRTLALDHSRLTAAPHITITGADADCFSISDAIGDLDETSSHNIVFKPKAWQDDYTAAIRISSPNAEDLVIPLTGKCVNSSSVGDISVDNSGYSDVPAVYYDLRGICLGQDCPDTPGIYIIRKGAEVSKISVK